MTIVEPEMGIWPQAAPDKEELVTMDFKEGARPAPLPHPAPPDAAPPSPSPPV
jgi:hypothetical protein